MNELIGADAYIAQTLDADAELAALVQGVHSDFAPEGIAESDLYPLVRFHYQGGGDVLGGHAQRLFVQPLYLVAVVHECEGYAAIQAAASRLDTLLTTKTPAAVTIGGESFLVRSHRETPFRISYVANAKRYHELGGLFRLTVEPAP